MRSKILLLAGTVVIGIYLFGVFLFFQVFPFRTYVDGEKVSFALPQDIAMEHITSTKTDSLVFKLRGDVEETALFSDLGIYRIADITPASFELHPFQWPLSLFKDTEYETDKRLDWDADVLSEALSNLRFMSSDYAVEPSDAYVKLSPDGSFEVVPEVAGTTVDFDRLFDAVCDVISQGGREVDLDAMGCYKKPSVVSTNEDLIALCDNFNKVLSVDIKIDMGYNQVEVLPRSVVEACLSTKKQKVVLDYDILSDYVRKLAKKYDTVGSTRRFVTSSGDKIEIPTRSSDIFYGWELNQEQTLAVICDLLLAGESGKIDAVWSSQGYSHDSEDNDFGDSYIEISIENQHMWLYLDGELVCDTDVTTGTDAPATRTPVGMFHTMDFNREYTMHGSYGTAFSHYFIRITPDGVGIHDSSWRSRYGGTEYIRNGSHGCINTPYDKVDFIYWRLMEYNQGAALPVIVY